MVLSKEELTASRRNEDRILLHLAGKVDKSKLDYRPVPSQRSTFELLQYMDFDKAVAAIQKQSDDYAHLLSDGPNQISGVR
jgi:hypothetical protein